MTSLYRTWNARLDTGVLTHTQVRRFASTISPIANHENPTWTCSLQWDQCLALWRRIQRNPVAPDDVATNRGKGWLRQYGRSRLGMTADEHKAIMAAFDRFSFNGEYVRSERTIHPVWTVHLKRPVCGGHVALQYYNLSWQAMAYDQFNPDHRGEFWWGTEGRDV